MCGKDLCKLGKEYLMHWNASFIIFSRQNSETFNISHTFLMVPGKIRQHGCRNRKYDKSFKIYSFGTKTEIQLTFSHVSKSASNRVMLTQSSWKTYLFRILTIEMHLETLTVLRQYPGLMTPFQQFTTCEKRSTILSQYGNVIQPASNCSHVYFCQWLSGKRKMKQEHQ